jgi:hypothetical protein
MPFIEQDFRINAATAGDHEFNQGKWNEVLGIYATGATGAILLLPKARVYSLQPNINDAHRGLVFQGSGTETKLINLTTTPVPGYVLRADTQNFGYLEYPSYGTGGSQLQFTSQAEADNYRLNDVVWMFQPNAAGSNIRTTVQQRYTVTATGPKTVTLSAPIATGSLAAKWTKGGRIVTEIFPDRKSIKVFPTSEATGFNADTWSFLADGAAVNTIYGEFVRVIGNTATGAVMFDDFIRRTGYHPGTGAGDLTALIPGPFLEDIAIRDLVIGGEGGTGAAGLFLIGCVGLTLENVQFELGDPAAVAGTAFALANCRKVTLVNCRIPYGTGFNNVQNLVVYGGEIANFECEEYCQEIEIHGTRLSGDFTIFPTCEDVKVFGGSHTLFNCPVFCDRFGMYGAKLSANAFGITGASPALVDVEVTSPIGIGINAGCTDGFIAGVRFPSGGGIQLAFGSSGQYVPVRYDPATGVGGVVVDNSRGGWSALGANQVVLAVPSAVNDYTQFGSVIVSRLNPPCAAWVRVLVNVTTGFARAKQYHLSWASGLPLGTWFKLNPLVDSSAGGDDDFEVNVREVERQDPFPPPQPVYTVLELRLRRTVGTTTATVAVRVETNGVFQPENFITGTDLSVLAQFGSTVLTQADGKVGIGTATPMAKVHVEGATPGTLRNDGNPRALLTVGATGNPTLAFHRGKTGVPVQATALVQDWAWQDDADFDVRWVMTSDSELQFTGSSLHPVTHTFMTPVKFTSLIGFFGSTPVGRQEGPGATAGPTYTANEQNMIQRMYNALRAYNLIGGV